MNTVLAKIGELERRGRHSMRRSPASLKTLMRPAWEQTMIALSSTLTDSYQG